MGKFFHGGGPRLWRLLPTIVVGALLAAAACVPSPPLACDTLAASAVEPARRATPPPTRMDAQSNPKWWVPPSLEEQIFDSEVIVRATLQSVAAVAEAAEVVGGSGYRAVQELRFRVHEYLKGSGPDTQLVAVRGGETYASETEACAAARTAVWERTTVWDDREGVLFLRALPAPYTPVEGAAAMDFTRSNYPVQSRWDYGVETLSRAWLPAREAGGAAGAATQSYMTDGAQTPPPVITLAKLRAKIAAMAAELAAGEGVAGYERCLWNKIGHERYQRAVLLEPFRLEKTLVSGAPAGSEVYTYQHNQSDPQYVRFWISGPDEHLFQTKLIDVDADPATGSEHHMVTARPLPAGAYRARYTMQHYTNFPCNFVPDNSYLEVTVRVSAPQGTVYEAFFDAVELDEGVGADGSAGVLQAGSVRLVTMDVVRLVWNETAGEVRMQRTDGGTAPEQLQVLGMDGTVKLTLALAAAETAATDDGGCELRWDVDAAPWEAGGKLLLRLSSERSGRASTLPSAVIGCTAASAATPTTIGAPRPDAVEPARPEITITGVQHDSVYPSWYVPPSLEEQIFTSEVIVRATLQSVAAAAEAVEGGGYRAVQELRFRVHEYLKGSGPDTRLVAVRGEETYASETAARAAAQVAVAGRTTTWDDREGVLFLEALPAPYAPAGGAAAMGFTRSNYAVQSRWDYGVETLSRAWLPGRDAGGAGAGAAGAAAQSYVTDGAQTPPPVVTLAELRAKIAAMAAELAAGEGVEGYEECLRRIIRRERYNRASPWTPEQFDASLSSGTAAGTVIFRHVIRDRDEQYFNYWMSGPDKDQFQAVIVDEDTDSSNGYEHRMITARPLPAGVYRVKYNSQAYWEFPCNFFPEDAYIDMTVRVSAPQGTLYEAFFDAVELGYGVGADGSAGVLQAGSERLSTMDVVRLVWNETAGEVRMQRTDGGTVPEQLQVIGTDGTVKLALTLAAAETAATDDGGCELRWEVDGAPWEAGGKLLLRLSGDPSSSASTVPSAVAACTAVAATPTPTPIPGVSGGL